ncbi:MAG: HEPN domain-containing protein [Candidatus Poribacteria bacterium]|nr:HEPN domain-containing protein [Candidatus Poribacteria bacterium]
MVTRRDIEATCADIVREFSPLQIILFGSYAYGVPTEHSDVDLLVVMPIPKSENRRQALAIREQIPSRFSMDIIVRSPEEIAYRISHNDWFLKEVTERGEVLYESENNYIKPFKKENMEMNPLTIEWVEKAEGDYSVAKENQQGPNPVHHVICFLAQQCAEKYLKACLQEMNIPIIRTHNLSQLLDLILPAIPDWKVWQADLSKLSDFAVDTRYPAQTPSESDVVHAMQTCEMVRLAVREHLKLPDENDENEIK